MAREKIKVYAYVHVGDKLVDVDTLNAAQKDVLAAKLRETYLNELFAGQAVFSTPGFDEMAEKANFVPKEGRECKV